ncbi:hypothetical protein ACJ41P_23395 [Azospirillum argentinense]|uniref:Uncharacterized protein n=1 Tax=Azospirillum argentinense TaxID=2970906 RepID=A0ABW8VFN8_9PROT
MSEAALAFWMFEVPARCRDAEGRRLGKARALLLSHPRRQQRMMLELAHDTPLATGSRVVTRRAAFVVERCEGESGFGFRRYAVRCVGTRPAP